MVTFPCNKDESILSVLPFIKEQTYKVDLTMD